MRMSPCAHVHAFFNDEVGLLVHRLFIFLSFNDHFSLTTQDPVLNLRDVISSLLPSFNETTSGKKLVKR